MTLGPQLLLSGMKPSCVVSDTQPQVYTQVINQHRNMSKYVIIVLLSNRPVP